MADNTTLPPPPDNVTRYTLSPETELRIEIPALSGGNTSSTNSTTITLKQGSAELFGAELPPNVHYHYQM